ncbi:Cation channel sperm-associated protein 1 (CatSper1) [Durusdinium trenchii]|uniref:Cation channel sperm-associated protein 1 (CatSper1) n=1 Tax=Durusdinium trenchii TaxID=1381693 RepID=A0ABP0I063_9DINO
MAVAAVMARRQEAETPKVVSLTVATPSSPSRPSSAFSTRSFRASDQGAKVQSFVGDDDWREKQVSKAVSVYSSKREVADDEFQEILQEQGVADIKTEEEEVTPRVQLVETTEFESGIGVMIAINAVLMGFEVDLAKTGDIGWIIVENFFCILWITEMLLKLRALRLEYFWSPFNLLDFALVLLAIAEAWIIPFLLPSTGGPSGLGVIRIVRIMRMLRLLRLIRLMKLFKNLWLIIVGFRESLSTLFWVIMLLTVVIYVFAIFLRYTLNCLSSQFEDWNECEEYFGSMPAAMYTMFQVITLESWSQVFARPIVRKQPAFLIFFLLFLFLTTFGILNIIVGVIVENTLNAAKQNQELQERRMQRQLRQELESIRRLFEEADADGSGTLEKTEFIDILNDPVVQATLTRMEIPIDDPGALFEILDPQGNDSLSFPTFAQGVLRVKGPPTQLDMKTMQLGVTSISKRVTKVEQLGDGNGLAGSWSYMRSHLTSYAATLGREGGDTTL